MIAGQSVFVERTFGDGRRRHDPGDVDVGQAVGEVVDVDVDSISGHLTFDASVAGSEEKVKFIIFKF